MPKKSSAINDRLRISIGTDEEMDEFAEKTAKKWGVDCEELCSEFFEFSDYVHSK